MPQTAALIRDWDGEGLPDEQIFASFAAELRQAYDARMLAIPAKRLAYDLPGFRSLLLAAGRKLPEEPAGLVARDPDRARSALGRDRHLGGDPARRGPLDAALPSGRARPPTGRRRTDRARAAGAGDLRRHPAAHLLDQLRGHGALPAARLSARLPAGVLADPDQQPAPDPGADAVLDLASGAHRRLGRAAAAGGSGQRAPASAPHHRSAAAAGVQPLRPLRRDDPHPAAVHGAAAVQRDARHPAPVHARRGLARRPPAARVPADLPAADRAGHRRRLSARVHSRARLLHHARAGRRRQRPDDQLFRRLLTPPTRSTGAWPRRSGRCC